MDEPSKAILVPGNRFEYLEAQAAFDAVAEGQRDGEAFRPGGLDVLAQHVMGVACAGPFNEAALLDEVQSALPYSGLDAATFRRVIEFVATGGYALKAYDKFRKLVAFTSPLQGRGSETWQLCCLVAVERGCGHSPPPNPPP